MKAIITCETRNYGCQESKDGRIIDWTAGGTVTQTVEFEADPKLSDKVNALKHFKPLYQFGNSVIIPTSFSVEIIEK